MSETSEEWELCKENIRPIQQGRKQKVLKVALGAHPEDIILQQRQSFENELRTYSGDDHLAVWCDYIKWVEQNFPKGGREGHIKELIERCLSILKNEKKYYDDDRFIDIMLKYAMLGDKPIDIYNYMFSNKIGCKSAMLFINWSWILEQMGNLKKADEILNEGIRHRARPDEKIRSYYNDFEIRLAGKIKTNLEQNDCESENGRSAFAMLKPQKKNLAPILRTGEAVVENKKKPLLLGRQQPQPKSSFASRKVPFNIYNSENVDSSLPMQSRNISSAITSENYKENEQKPSKWNKVKVKSHGLLLKTPSEAKPEFQFHCDAETKLEFKTPRSVPSTSKILTTRCRTPPLPMTFFEPVDPLTRNMYPKNKIYGGAEEYSLEEIRAAEWFERKKKTEQEMLIQQPKEIENIGKAKEDHKEMSENIAKQVELLQNHSQNSTNPELNHAENFITENNKFYEMLSTEKLEVDNEKSKHGIKIISDSESKDNLDNIFSLKTNLLTKFCMPDSLANENSTSNEDSKTVQNVRNKTELCSINDTGCDPSSNNRLGERNANYCTNDCWSDFNDSNQNKQMKKNAEKSNTNLSFAFYHDPEND